MLLSAGCCSNKATGEVEPQSKETTPDEAVAVKFRDGGMRGGGTVNFLPHGVIYRTNGNYDDNVTVMLDASRQALVMYPAPTDVSTASAPLVMADGWLLDRRGGIGDNTAFLDWTYAQYAQLPETPSQAEIMRHIIPSARVTAVKVLPMAATAALADTAAVNVFIRSLSVRTYP